MLRKIFFTILLAMSAISQAQIPGIPNRIGLFWDIEYREPVKNEISTVGANVPGAVQLDVGRSEGYGPHFYGENWRDYGWMEDETFTYRTRFNRPDTDPDERLYFVSGGIDYEFEIRLNGDLLLEQEGMFTPVRIDITDLVNDANTLEVKILPVPKLHRRPADRSQAAQSVKPAVSYGWDWHPRLIPSGIWKETYLEKRPSSTILSTDIRYTLNESLSRASVTLQLQGRQLTSAEIIWKIRDARDQVVASRIIDPLSNEPTAEMELDNLQLWWPHDHGTPYLYTSSLEVRDMEGQLLQLMDEKIGFKKVRLVMNEGAWDEPQGFPKSRSVAPAQLEINGRKIFCKGTNWVNPEIFPGVITEDRYDELTDRALEANFNMLRVWGGGIVNKESFYQLCSEKGLLVWQEFPLACNNYVGTPEYLEVLEQEARSIIKSVRKHACLAMWSGGNELFNAWSGMDDQSLALRMLNSLCFQLDPHIPFIATSPLEGMGHGHYVFRDMDTGEEVYSTMARAHNTAYTEFGMPSPAPVDLLERIIPRKELWPPRPGTAWESHHAYNAWVGDTWLMQDMIEDYFGPSNSLQELVTNGQTLQSEGYKAIYEEARRQKPYCSMALNWCFNEPWPTAANNSLISYPNTPKPALEAVAASCRPVLASARISKLQWKEGEVFTTDLYLLNDSYDPVQGGTMIAKLVAGNQEKVLLRWDFSAPEPNRNEVGPMARGYLPSWNTDRFKLVVEVVGKPEYRSEYLLLYEPDQRGSGTRTMNQ